MLITFSLVLLCIIKKCYCFTIAFSGGNRIPFIMNLLLISNKFQEYRKKQKVFIERCKDLEELTQKRTKMKELHESLRNRRKEEFLNGYSIIKMKLKEMYQMITLGGDADFELVDTYDPFTEGIQFK